MGNFDNYRILNLFHEEYFLLDKQYQKLATSIIKKHGIAKALKTKKEVDEAEISYDVAFFCFTKSIRLNESIQSILKICNYEDAFILLRSVYENYIYIAYLRKDNDRVLDSIFKIGLNHGIFVHPITKKGKQDKSKILDTRDNNIYQYGIGIYEKAQQTCYTSDKLIHNLVYKFLSEHCHVNMLTSGNYRDEKTHRYKVRNNNHEQLTYLFFLKTYFYTIILDEIRFYIKESSNNDNLRIAKVVDRNKRHLIAFLKVVEFKQDNGSIINPIFLERISYLRSS